MGTQIEKPVEEKAPAEHFGRKSTAREYLESLVVTVILALFGTTFLVQAFKIPSSSMEDTLLIGDHLMVDKIAYGPPFAWDKVLPYTPVQRDQIIVFRYPMDPTTYFVKRVIGVPGDRIRLEAVHGEKRVYRNGVLLNEPYVVHKSFRIEDFRDNFPNGSAFGGFPNPNWPEQYPQYVQNGELVVPPGQYFAMGDNRDLSSDSRYWGFVPRENIVGKPLIIYWSLVSTGDEYRQQDFGDYATGLIQTIIHFPQKTRWDRMFRIIH